MVASLFLSLQTNKQLLVYLLRLFRRVFVLVIFLIFRLVLCRLFKAVTPTSTGGLDRIDELLFILAENIGSVPCHHLFVGDFYPHCAIVFLFLLTFVDRDEERLPPMTRQHGRRHDFNLRNAVPPRNMNH